MDITILQSNPIIQVQQGESITILQQNPTIRVEAEVFMASSSFKPFNFEATEGQTVFTLVDAPVGIILLVINGITQNFLKGDFSLSGHDITLSSGVSEGDFVYGVYQFK